MGETLRDVIIVQHRHVLQGGQSRAPGLFHLRSGRKALLRIQDELVIVQILDGGV